MARIDTLFPRVHILRGEVGGRPLGLPLLVGNEQALLIDTGCASDPEELIVPALRELNVPLERLGIVITTHCDLDHQGGNAAIKRAAPQTMLYCGDADRTAVESPDAIFAERYDAYAAQHQHVYSDDARASIRASLGDAQRVDRTLHGGERFQLDDDWEVEILHLPGHSHGHLGVWDHKHNVVFGGDAIQGAVYLSTTGMPALCPTYLHVQPYLRTIARIESLGLDGYVGCHWPYAMTRDAVLAFCAESRAFVERAEAGVLDAIRNAGTQGITLSELCWTVGLTLGDWPHAMNFDMCYAVGGHLADLTARGRIHEHRDAIPFRYTVAA